MIRTAPLGQVADINPRSNLELDDDAEVSFIPMAAVDEAGGSYREEVRTYGEVRKGYTSFESGDVLLAKITPCMENGKVACLNGLKSKIGFGSTEFHVLRAGPELDRRYLFHMLWNPRFRYLAEKRMTGAGGQRRVPTAFLKEYEIPLPKKSEQVRIAAILDKADSIRCKRRQALAEIDALLRATFLDMFGDLARNPRNYAIKSIAELVDPERPVTYGILMPGPDVEAGVPYIRVTDIQGGRVLVAQVRRTTSKIADEYRRSRLQPGDLLLSIRGHVGRMAFTPDELDGANITQDTARLAIKNRVDAIYLRASLESPGYQHLMAQRTKGGAVKGINLGDVKALKIPMAPERERKAFAAAWLQMQAMVDRGRQSLQQAEQLFGSLSQRAFRGEL